MSWCTLEKAFLDVEDVVGLDDIRRTDGSAVFLSVLADPLHHGAPLGAARREAAADGDGARNRHVAFELVDAGLLHLAIDVELLGARNVDPVAADEAYVL